MTTFAPKTEAVVKPDFTMLHDILCMMRPDGSKTEQRFVDKYIKPLGAEADDIGNHIIRIGNDPVMWSCHTDTVHQQGGYHPIRVDDAKGMIDLHPKSQANCLGADDGAGVWVMINMILAKKSGLYVFHRGEERGGIGSKFSSTYTPELVKGIKYAIALDRKGKDSIITHQWGGRCCSEAFAKSLEAELGMGLKSDDGGSFTDTANYVGLIGECTNLSVGYRAQHSRVEDLDQDFLAWLLERLLVLDVSKLVSERKPGDKEARQYGGYSNWRGHNNNAQTKKEKKKADKEKKEQPALYRWRAGKVIQETYLTLVEDYPEEVAQMLEDSRYDLEFLRSAIRRRGGIIAETSGEGGGVH